MFYMCKFDNYDFDGFTLFTSILVNFEFSLSQ